MALYFRSSKNIYYSILVILPMLFIYEFLCWLHFLDNDFQLRNGADVLLRQIFRYFGGYSEIAYASSLMIIFLLILFLNRDVIKGTKFNIFFMLFMLLESFFWCCVLLLLFDYSQKILFIIMDSNILSEQIYLSIGAGIWEEIFFRVILISLVQYLFFHILEQTYFFSIVIAIVCSAFLFSFFHYVGDMAEAFTFQTFYIRVMAGIFLALLYTLRGFGIVAYTHIFYDMSIVSMPVLIDRS